MLALKSIPRTHVPSHIPDPDTLLKEIHECFSTADEEDKPLVANALFCLLEVMKRDGPENAIRKLCQQVEHRQEYDHVARMHRIKMRTVD